MTAYQAKTAATGFASAAWQLLDSFPDQLVKLLRLRGERLHLVLSKLRLKRQNLLKILCLGDLFDQRES